MKTRKENLVGVCIYNMNIKMYKIKKFCIFISFLFICNDFQLGLGDDSVMLKRVIDLKDPSKNF